MVFASSLDLLALKCILFLPHSLSNCLSIIQKSSSGTLFLNYWKLHMELILVAGWKSILYPSLFNLIFSLLSILMYLAILLVKPSLNIDLLWVGAMSFVESSYKYINLGKFYTHTPFICAFSYDLCVFGYMTYCAVSYDR